MFADDICVLSKCTWVAKNTRCVSGLCRIAWNYFQLQQHCLYDVLRLRPQMHCHPLLTPGVPRVKALSHYKHLGFVLDIELSDVKTFWDNCAISILYSTDESFFLMFERSENVLFLSFCRSMYNYISGKYASTDLVWPVTLLAGLYTTCRGDRVLVVIRFNVTFLPLRPYWKTCVGLPVSWTIQVQQCMVARFDAVRFFIPVFLRIL